MIDEEARMRRHPGIAFIDRPGGRDAVLADRPRLSVWLIVEAVRGSTTRAAAAKSLSTDEASVARAMAYADDYPEEIAHAIRENEEALERIKRR